MKDILSDQEFLVDSGASVSVFPGPRLSSDDEVRLLTADGVHLLTADGVRLLTADRVRLLTADRVRLLTADGFPMICSGSCLILLQFSCGSGSRVYTWNFQLAPVSIPLL